jgi:hypothetical protein
MRTIYLDQNKWIELAKMLQGSSEGSELAQLWSRAVAAADAGSVCFPLSAIHYMELARVSNPKRRKDVGEVLWRLSGGQTIASHRTIVEHEIETALAFDHPQIQPRAFELVSKGIALAFGMTPLQVALPKPLRERLPENAWGAAQEAFDLAVERSHLTGVGPGGECAPPFRSEVNRMEFQSHLQRLHPTLADLPRKKWDDFLFATCILDILEPLERVLTRHDLSLASVSSGGRKAMKRLIEDMPSRRVDLHLHRQVARNPQFKPKKTDLEDWAGLGPAAAYCDIVVCERHFADMIRRDGFATHAVVFTDLLDLNRYLDVAAEPT